MQQYVSLSHLTIANHLSLIRMSDIYSRYFSIWIEVGNRGSNHAHWQKVLTGIMSENIGRVHIPYFKQTPRSIVLTLQQNLDSGNVESILAVCSSNIVSSWNYFVSLLFLLLFSFASYMCEYGLDFHIGCKNVRMSLEWNGTL